MGAAPARGPDFVILGAMKAGTTTLFRWLGEHPGVVLPATKEPHHFTPGSTVDRAAYLALFADVPDGLLTGEASAGYADARYAQEVAARLAQEAPAARLVYLVREPVARLRSHYAHEVRRGRERSTLIEALARPDNPYVARSSYGTVLAAFGDEVLVARTDRLEQEWPLVLRHLGLDDAPCPGTVHNQGEQQLQLNTVTRWLWSRGLLRGGLLPPTLRRTAKRLLSRQGEQRQRLLASAVAPLPAATLAVLRAELQTLHALAGTDVSDWSG